MGRYWIWRGKPYSCIPGCSWKPYRLLTGIVPVVCLVTGCVSLRRDVQYVTWLLELEGGGGLKTKRTLLRNTRPFKRLRDAVSYKQSINGCIYGNGYRFLRSSKAGSEKPRGGISSVIDHTKVTLRNINLWKIKYT